jgi:hypothetical protein
LGNLQRQLEPPGSTNWQHHHAAATAAAARGRQLQSISKGFFYSSKLPADEELEQLISDIETLDKLAQVGCAVGSYSQPA